MRTFRDEGSRVGADGQMELFPFQPVTRRREASIDERFLAFHYANPHVYRNLLVLAHQLKRAGRERIGIKLLFEKLRWEYLTRTDQAMDAYAINNDFTSRYSRLLMQDPGLAGMFKTRALRDTRKSA